MYIYSQFNVNKFKLKFEQIDSKDPSELLCRKQLLDEYTTHKTSLCYIITNNKLTAVAVITLLLLLEIFCWISIWYMSVCVTVWGSYIG